MADFVLCRGRSGATVARRVRSRLFRLGLTFEIFSEDDTGCLLLRESSADRHVSVHREAAGSWILRSGQFSYRNLADKPALTAFLSGFDFRTPSLTGTRGQFVLVLKHARTLYLTGDLLGTNKVYCSSDHTLYSNLFIAIAEGQAGLSLDWQGCYEYVWNGCPGGQKTMFQEIRSLPPGAVTVLAPDARPARLSLPALDLREDEPPPRGAAAAAALHLERLRRLMAGYRRAFGDRANLLFSGGYDSRLLLALLLDAGFSTRITSYGRPSDLDCRIAQEVADGERLEFNLVDKSRRPPIPCEDYGDHLIRNLAAFDGWKLTGLFDNGADIEDRAAQVADGSIKFNGSLGEIYRNFFYLPDRGFSARDLVWSFYSRNDPAACTDSFGLAEYERHLAQEILASLDSESDRLSRQQVELVYPLFRGRFWTARDVPANQNFGSCLFPFMEPSVIKGTCDLPIAWKSHGRLEGRIIRQLNPKLAAYPSSYGHCFSADAPLSSVLRSQSSYRRPPFLRRLSFRFQQRRRRSRPYYLREQYLTSVMDPDFPYLRELFKLERINDEDVLNRVATLEYLCQRYNAAEPPISDLQEERMGGEARP